MDTIVKFLMHYPPYIAGDLVLIRDEDEAKKILKYGIAVKYAPEHSDTPEPDGEVFVPELTGKNIFGKRYKKGKVDVVIPTPNPKKVTFVPNAKQVESVTRIVRKFSPEVGGFAQAVNDGAKIYENLAEFILFLNDDAELEPDFFDHALKEFKDKRVAIVGNESSNCGHFINGSIMLIRREIFERTGGFDTRYFFMWEDNDICKNIEKRGYKWVVSKAPAKHTGKASVQTETEFWKTNFYNGKAYFEQKWHENNRVIGAMIVGNESGRYLEMSVNDLFERSLIDELVVVIDAATDNTNEILKELAKRWKISIYNHPKALFGKKEAVLRERAIDYALSKNPKGIITMDSDEVFDEEVTRKKIDEWLKQPAGIGWDFYIAHFWSNTERVRLDGLFGHQKNIRLFRVDKTKHQAFYDTPVHCGSAPIYAYENRRTSDHLFKHYGYASEKDIDDKIKRYAQLDPKGYYESQDFYDQFKKVAITITYNKAEFINNWKK